MTSTGLGEEVDPMLPLPNLACSIRKTLSPLFSRSLYLSVQYILHTPSSFPLCTKKADLGDGRTDGERVDNPSRRQERGLPSNHGMRRVDRGAAYDACVLFSIARLLSLNSAPKSERTPSLPAAASLSPSLGVSNLTFTADVRLRARARGRGRVPRSRRRRQRRQRGAGRRLS